MSLCSCSSEEETDYIPMSGEIDFYMSVSPTSATVEARDATKTISITSNTTWTASKSDDWCDMSSTSGSGDQDIELIFDDNTDLESRQITITVVSSVTTSTVTITQQAGSLPSISDPTVSDIERYSAIVSGTYESQFDATEYGVVYSTTSKQPTADDDSCVSYTDGGTSGTIYAELSNLNSATTYYVRLFVVSAVGTEYSSASSFTTSGATPSEDDNPTPSY